jgi:hypothetical protein
MKGKRSIIFATIVMVMLFGAGLVFSQEKASDNMQIVVEKIRADKKLLVAENMQLTEGEAKAFWPVYKAYQDELFLQRTRAANLIKSYSDSYGTMTNERAKKLMNEYIAIESSGAKLRQSYVPKFRKVLPEVKVVRYYQIENKIHAALMYEVASQIPLIKLDK